MAAIVTKDGVIESPKTKWIQVSNISQNAKKDQIRKLFNFFGAIEEMHVHPSDDFTAVSSKVSYIRFANFHSSNGAIHLTNSVFVDRPLIITPIFNDKIPDEETAISNAKLLASSDMTQYVIGGMIMSGISQLSLNFGFPHVPSKPLLDADLSDAKIEEIQRTVLIHNIHVHTTAEIILALFSGVGEIKYIRLCDCPENTSKYALVEYSDANSVLPALQYHGFPIFGRPIQTAYSCTYIKKPEDWRKRPASKHSKSPSPTKFKRLSPPRYTQRSILRYSRSPSFGRYRRRRSRSRDRRPLPVRSPPPPRRRERSKSPAKTESKHRKRSKSKDRKSSKKHKNKKDRSRSKDRKRSRSGKDSKKDKSKKKRSKRSASRKDSVRSRSSS